MYRRNCDATVAETANAAETAKIDDIELTWELWGVPETIQEFVAFYGHAVNPDTKKLAEYRELINSTDAQHWVKAMEDECGRLMDGTEREPNSRTKQCNL
jgi:hypothetical protein